MYCYRIIILLPHRLNSWHFNEASSIIYATTILRIHPWQSILTFSLFINIYNDLYSSLQGATIKAEEGTGRILIARVMHGGAADRSGLISCGDEVIEVNGVNVEGKTPNDVLKILVRNHLISSNFIVSGYILSNTLE